MECLCYTERKKVNSKKSPKKTVKEHNSYWDKIEKITSPKLDSNGVLVDVNCNYILCEHIVKSGKEKNVILNNKHYQFCSEECWYVWLSSGQNLTHYAWNTPVSKELMAHNSPEYLEYYKTQEELSNIPPLFI